MSYTNTELIRHHFNIDYPKSEKIIDQKISLEGLEYLTFFGGKVESNSFSVKTVMSLTQSKTDITLNESTSLISSLPLVPGSIMVASDRSMATIYTANIDYAINYSSSTLIIKPAGSLTVGMKVTVWYIPYTLYLSGSDYQINNDTGEIKRLAGGSISDGETVYLDYTPLFVNFSEELIDAAVTEANNIIEKSIDPNRQFGANLMLQSAASYLALAVLCRSSSIRNLSSGISKEKTSTVWLTMASEFDRQSEKYLSAFVKPGENYSAPTHT